MGMEVNLIQAGRGDCILVRCGVGTEKVNLLIDSGISKEYFLKALSRIADNGEKIDIFVCTHDDNDHIKGALGLLKELNRKETGKKSANPYNSIGLDGRYRELFKDLTEERILFNFGGNGTEALLGVTEARELFENLERMDIQKLDFVLADADGGPDVPYPNMLQLRWKDVGDGLQSRVIRQLKQSDLKTEEEHLEIVILSPKKQVLADYIHSAWEEWQKKDVPLKAEGKKSRSEWEKSIQFWMQNQIDPKDEVNPVNRASIAFLILYGDCCGLFAGDASSAEMLCAGREYLARKQIKQDYLEVDFIKLPHHGSSHNVSKEFFSFFRTKTFFVTTEGSAQYRHPGKRTLALIAASLEDGETADIYSSYSWWKENKEFCRSERSEGNWVMSETLCELKDADGTVKFLRFHKTCTEPIAIGKDIFVRR